MLILLVLVSIPIMFLFGVCFGLCVAFSWISRKRSERYMSSDHVDHNKLKSKSELCQVIVDNGIDVESDKKKKKSKKKKHEKREYLDKKKQDYDYDDVDADAADHEGFQGIVNGSTLNTVRGISQARTLRYARTAVR